MRAWPLTLGLWLAGCGGNPDVALEAGSPDAALDVMDEPSPMPEAGRDVSAGPDAGYPGPHPAVPQVVNVGGSTMTAPNVVPIFFQNDSLQTQVEDFLHQLTSSSYWTAATGEYSVGTLSIAKSVVVTDTPPGAITGAEIRSWLAGYLTGTHAGWPTITSNNIYVIIYPTSSTVINDGSGTSCQSFGGYHEQTVSGQIVSLAVMPRCAGIDLLTEGLSHEIVEAATDPLPYTAPAYELVDAEHFIWNFLPLGEVGDMCAYPPQSAQRLVGSYLVQRIWSNLSAAAGHDPCVPVLNTPYFNSAPVLSDMVTLSYQGQSLPTLGVQVSLGQSKTIDVQLFSDGPTSDWSVRAYDSSTLQQGPAQLTFTWDKEVGNNGDTLHLTIKRVANGPYGGSELVLYSEQSVNMLNLWAGFIAN